MLSRVTNDVDNIQTSLSMTISQLLTSVLTVVAVFVMMLTISPLLALITVLTVPLSLLATRTIARRSQRLFVAQWRNTGRLNAHIEETYSGFTVVKTFGHRALAEDEFRELNDDVYQASFGAQFLSGLVGPATTFVGNVSYVAVAVVGGIQVATGQITLGSIQAFIQYVRQFNQPLTQVASMYNTMQSGIASAERVFDLLDADEQTPDSPAPRRRPSARRPRRVRARRLRLPAGHADHRGPVAGRRARQHRRDRRPDRGGQDHPGEPAHAVLRGRLRTHPDRRRRHRDHEPGINCGPGSAWCCRTPGCSAARSTTTSPTAGPTRPSDEVVEAAKAAHVDRFVHTLPNGYQTWVNDDGGNISAGEKQLITIARALLAQPRLLILDEATSSVDTRTELLIQLATAELRRDRTSFIIAHRLSTIRDADVILVMEAGQIVERGTHAELLARRGEYWSMTQV